MHQTKNLVVLGFRTVWVLRICCVSVLWDPGVGVNLTFDEGVSAIFSDRGASEFCPP